MKLVPISKLKYEAYKLDAIFNGYKWDPQFSDNNTIAEYALVITKQEHEELMRYTRQLDKETFAAERLLCENPDAAKALKLPRKIKKELKRLKSYQPDAHIRLTRYDFHPTLGGGFAISELNSDVPGGFAEASILPAIAAGYIERDSGTDSERGNYGYVDFGEVLIRAITKKVKPPGIIMMVHCTSYSDDRQVMQFLGDRLSGRGYRIIYAAADHLNFHEGKAISILDGNEGEIDAIVRFSPLEWIIDMKPKRWEGYFDTTTPSCNHPAAVFAQTKLFPMIWDRLEQSGVSMQTWCSLLPETLRVRDAKSKGKNMDGFIYKPVWGRVGEGISIKEACKDDEYKKILKAVKRHPGRYLVQKQFKSKALTGTDGENYHVCIGAFGVDGEPAGYYARISKTLRIDSGAADIPVLIEGEVTVNTENAISTVPVSEHGCPARDVFLKWAPPGAAWRQYIKPVCFVALNYILDFNVFINMRIPELFYFESFYGLNRIPENTALFIDLPDYESIREAIALARLGFRPVPLFNGTIPQCGAMALVDNTALLCALVWGAQELEKLELANDAPPAFLLDSNRLHRHRINTSVFDNSWDLYAQDIPSAEYFLKSGVSKILVRGAGKRINKDLRKILVKYKKKGIEVNYIRF